MGRQYYGISETESGDTYQVELHNSGAALDHLLTIKTPFIDWKTEGDWLPDVPIISSQATCSFVMRTVSDHTNFKDISGEPEEEWSMKILKNGSLWWAGLVVADLMRFPREYRDSGHAIVEVNAVDGLNLIDGFPMSDISFTIGDRQTVVNTITQMIGKNGLQAFWGASDVYLQDGIKTVNATSSAGTLDGSIRDLAFIKNFDTFKDTNDVEWMSCREGLAAIMIAFGAQILHSEGKYVVRQAPVYDDNAYTVNNYDKDGGALAGSTYTHRQLANSTDVRPRWLAYPVKSFQRPIRACEVEFDREFGEFEYKSTSNTTVVSADLVDVVDGNPSGSAASIGRPCSVIFSFRLTYTNSVIKRWALRYKIFARNPTTGDIYQFANGIWYYITTGSTVSAYHTLNIETPALFGTFSATYEGREEFEFPQPPTDATTIHAEFYVEEQTGTIVRSGSIPPKVFWTTFSATAKAFTGSVLIRQSYTSTEPIEYQQYKKHTSDLDAPRDSNSQLLTLKSEFYNGRSVDVGSYLAWNGSNYVEAGNWSAPWTALTGDLPELLANQWAGFYSDYRPKIEGVLYDDGNYCAGFSLYFDNIIWIFNGGRFDIDSDSWDGEWIGVLTTYTNVNNNGEGERVLQEGDIITEKLRIIQEEISRLRQVLHQPGQLVLEEIINEGIDAPTSDPGRDRQWSLHTFYDSTEPDFNYKMVEENTIIKDADETTTSDATLTSDSQLKFYMEASQTYEIDISVFFTAGAGAFQYALTGPTSPLQMFVKREHGDSVVTQGFDIAYTSATAITGISPGFVRMKIAIANDANAGVFAFQWAQNSSNGAATTVHEGSSLKYRKV
jgi:hypothetical protein